MAGLVQEAAAAEGAGQRMAAELAPTPVPRWEMRRAEGALGFQRLFRSLTLLRVGTPAPRCGWI